MDTSVTEIDNKILAQLSYLDITSGSELGRIYKKNNNSVTVGEFLDYYKSYETDPVLNAQLHDRFKGEDYGKWTDFINDKELDKYSNWKITNYVSYNKPEESGFVGYTFEPEKGKAVVAFRGSEPMTDIKYRNDWETNGSLLYTECTKQQKDAGEYMKGLGKYSEITVTGHSLGGNLALYATIASSQEVRAKIGNCSTFNGPGFDGEFIKEHKEEIEQMGSKIHEFQNEHDATSSILYNLTKPIIIETTLKDNTNATDFANHSLSSLKLGNNNNELKRSESGQKDYVCRVVNAASKKLEKLPKQYLRDAEEVIFAVWSGRVDREILLKAVITMAKTSKFLSCIVVDGVIKAVVGTIAVAATKVKEVWVDCIVPGIKFTVEVAKAIYHETVNLIRKCVENVVRDAVLAGEVINEYIEMVDEAIDDFFSGLGTFISKHTGNHGKSNLYPKINVNKDNLKNITDRLQMVQSKIEKLDRNLDTLRSFMDVDEKIPVLLIDIKMGFNNDLKGCINYLNNVAYELNQCERSIAQKAYAL